MTTTDKTPLISRLNCALETVQAWREDVAEALIADAMKKPTETAPTHATDEAVGALSDEMFFERGVARIEAAEAALGDVLAAVKVAASAVERECVAISSAQCGSPSTLDPLQARAAHLGGIVRTAERELADGPRVWCVQ